MEITLLFMEIADEAFEEQKDNDRPDENRASKFHDSACRLLIPQHRDAPHTDRRVVVAIYRTRGKRQPACRDRWHKRQHEHINHLATRLHLPFAQRPTHGHPKHKCSRH